MKTFINSRAYLVFIWSLLSVNLIFSGNNASGYLLNKYKLYDIWSPSYSAPQRMIFGGMICLHEAQLSLDASGKVKVTPQMILSSSVANPADYSVKIVGTNTDTITCQSIGYKIKVQVIENGTSNSCWSFILVEDKLPPMVICRDTTVLCSGSLSDLDSIKNIVMIKDNCTPDELIRISKFDIIKTRDCADDTFSVVTRTWQAIDPWGRASSCTQKINLLRVNQSDIDFPNDTTIYCPNSNTSTEFLGQPSIDGKPLDKFCGWAVKYSDESFVKCGNAKKIIRTWSVLNCCALRDTLVSQFIVITDTTPPAIICPAPDSVSTSPDLCESNYLIKSLKAGYDSCNGTNLNIWVHIDGIKLSTPGKITMLNPGNHQLIYDVADPCGNKSTCTTNVFVKDLQKPTLLCPDSIQISLPADYIKITAENLSDISSFDNCAMQTVKLKKSIDNCVDGIDDTFFKDTIRICCAEVNQIFNLVFLAIDMNGNTDSCHVRAVVVDKNAPTLNCAQSDTFLCTSIGFVWKDPLVGLVDNCQSELKLTIDTILNHFNVCGVGRFERRIIAIDPAGNADTCFQSITKIQDLILQPGDILFAPGDDTIEVIGCGASLIAKGSMGYVPPLVEFTGNSCNRLDTIIEDIPISTIGTGRCAITKRIWKIGDSCFSTLPINTLIQIIIQDTSFSPSPSPLTGTVLTTDLVPIDRVMVDGMNHDQQMIYHQMTDRSGNFNTNLIQELATISLSKNVEENLDGISTLDLLRIQQHIIGTNKFTNPIDEVAADINMDGDINVLDLIALKKLILGIDSDYSKLPWKFVESNLAKVYLQPGIEISKIIPVNAGMESISLIGFRMGDVNHDATGNLNQHVENRSADLITTIEWNNMADGLNLHFSTQYSRLRGFQLSLISPFGWSDLDRIEADQLADISYSIIGNELRIVWFSNRSPQVIQDIKLRGAHPKTVTVGALHSEIYDVDNSVHPIEIRGNWILKENGISVYPNPMHDVLHVRLDSKFQNPSVWWVIDQTGRIVLKGNWSKGNLSHSIPVNFLSPGFYIFELQDGNTLLRAKMLKN